MAHEDQHHDHGDPHHADFFTMENQLRQDFDLNKDKVVEFLKKAGLKEGQHVLELGCGFAPLLELYGDTVGPAGSVTLLDPEARLGERLAPRLAGRPNARFVAGRAEDLLTSPDTACPAAGSDGCYDLAVMVNVYHHLADPDAALAALRSRLRPAGGRLLVFDFIHDTLHLFTSPAASAAATRVRERLSELLRPSHFAVSAQCAARLEASGFSVRLRDCYALHDRFSSPLGSFYSEVYLPHYLRRLQGAGRITEAERTGLLEQDLPALRSDPGAVLFSDLHIMLAADRV